MSAAREHYRAQFAQREAELPGATLPWLRRQRAEALERFAERGLPTLRDEDWKYTNVAAIEKRPFETRPAAANGLAAREVARFALDRCQRVVFVNGRFVPELSRLDALAGATIGSLAAALAREPGRVEAVLAAEPAAAHGFAALNAAFWSDGLWIDLAPGTVVEAPLHALYLTLPDGGASPATFPLNVVSAAGGAGVTLLEHYVGPDDAIYLTDAVTRIVAGEGATVRHMRLQQEGRRAFHIAEVGAAQATGSRFDSLALAFGAMLSRAGIATRFDGEGCSTELLGLYVGDGRRHFDHHTLIDHAHPRGVSREFYKGVLDGAARAVFNGRVVVRPDAQRTDALQANHNLLLSDEAEVDTKPQLEIYADDVKCSHGATVGQIDPVQRFYLRARGIDDAQAQALLVRAFAAEIVERVRFAPLRARLQGLLPGQIADEMGVSPCAEPVTN